VSTTVLVVDDDSANLDSVCRIFQKEGVATLPASDGQKALELLRKPEVGVLVDPGGAERLEPGDLGGDPLALQLERHRRTAPGQQVDVHAVLAGLRLRDPLEEDARLPLGLQGRGVVPPLRRDALGGEEGRPVGEPARGVGDDVPARREGARPERGQRGGVDGVDDDLEGCGRAVHVSTVPQAADRAPGCAPRNSVAGRAVPQSG